MVKCEMSTKIVLTHDKGEAYRKLSRGQKPRNKWKSKLKLNFSKQTFSKLIPEQHT